MKISRPPTFYQISPRILPNETKEQGHEKNGALMLSLEVWFFLMSLMHSPHPPAPHLIQGFHQIMPATGVCDPPSSPPLLALLLQLILLLSPDPSHDTAVLLQLSSVSPLLPPPLVLIVALDIVVFLHFLLVVLSNKNSLSLCLVEPKLWLSPWPRKLLPETSGNSRDTKMGEVIIEWETKRRRREKMMGLVNHQNILLVFLFQTTRMVWCPSSAAILPCPSSSGVTVPQRAPRNER
jgi:hypothetical protein